jgi:hypothetical protein
MRRAFFLVEGVPQSVFQVIFQARLYCGIRLSLVQNELVNSGGSPLY